MLSTEVTTGFTSHSTMEWRARWILHHGCKAPSLSRRRPFDGLLQVRSGWVGLQRGDREVLVPAGASCRIDARSGPGIPYFDNASETFRRILSGMEDGLREPGGLEQLLSECETLAA